jgi:phage gpG-like protein
MGYTGTVVGAKELQAQFGRILNAFSPPQVAAIMLPGAKVIAEEVKDHILQQGLVDKGDMYNAVKAVKVNQYSAGVEVGVPYAAVHEFGLQNQVATPKQIRFFWAKWAETKNTMWKALALKGSYTIPARPYFRPAVDAAKGKALDAVMREAASVLTRMAGIG